MTARVSLTGDEEIQRKIEESTSAWLRKQGFPNPEGIVFTNSKFKSQLLMNEDADVLIEDHLETCQDTVKMCDRRGSAIKAILMDQQWNRHGEHEIRANSLDEIPQLIESLFGVE